ncbi:hypothetical protein ACI3PL_26255, partial [Lacticaseibacillus paracasei]
ANSNDADQPSPEFGPANSFVPVQNDQGIAEISYSDVHGNIVEPAAAPESNFNDPPAWKVELDVPRFTYEMAPDFRTEIPSVNGYP